MISTLTPSFVALGANLLLLFGGFPKNILLRASLRGAGLAVLTWTLIHAGWVPTATIPDDSDSKIRFLVQLLICAWWLLTATTAIAVIHAYNAFQGRVHEHRFALDVVATLLYISAALTIVTSVFGLPLKGILATSGLLALVLGLALQSTLSDLFSGLVLSLSAPYRDGDWISIDADIAGKVLEVNWRATHLLQKNGHLMVIPNSLIAKSRIINSDEPSGMHATVIQFHARPDLRPSSVVLALQLALDNCLYISESSKSTIVTKEIDADSTRYEITFFLTDKRHENDVLNMFHDAAHRHIESFGMSLALASTPPTNKAGSSVERRLVDGIDIFGMLSEDDRQGLADSLVRHEVTPGQVMTTPGDVSQSIVIVAYGILSVELIVNGLRTEVLRLGPREHFGEGGPIAGLPINAWITAKKYAIVYELPATAVGSMLSRRADVTHVLAAKLAAREMAGRALMQIQDAPQPQQQGLFEWIKSRIDSLQRTNF